MRREKAINSIASLLDEDLVLFFYQLRIFPEQFGLDSSFWSKLCCENSSRLWNTVWAVGRNQKHLKNASVFEWEKYFTRNKSPIFSFVNLLSNVPDEVAKSAYLQYCKNKAHEIRVPDSVSECVVKSLDVKGGSLYHPCTSSQFLLDFVKKLPEGSIEVYGQFEKWTDLKNSKETVKTMNLHCAEIPANPLINDKFREMQFDYIIANPPFNFSFWNPDGRLYGDPRWIYGNPPGSNANFAWLQHVIYHLNKTGKAAVILPNSTLFGGTSSEKNIRRQIVCSGVISAVITFPRKLFRNTTTAFCIWLLDNNKSDKVLFIDAARLKTKAMSLLLRLPIRWAL